LENDETKQFAICQNGCEMRATPEPFPAPIGKLLGFTIVRDEEGKAAIEFEATENHANPMGTLHGGVLCDLADAAMGVAYRSTLAPGESFTTLELKINFLRPVWKAKLRAEARVVGGGKTVGLVECDVFDPRGRLVARASSTCLRLRAAAAQGRQLNEQARYTKANAGRPKSSFEAAPLSASKATPAFR
jgi:uncharacterized protein (TIGR00369 family)